jgi:hypothetical protein
VSRKEVTQIEAEVRHAICSWVKEVVIGLGFCPFARQPFESDRIRWAVYLDADIQSVLVGLMRELYHLDKVADTETTLMILPGAFPDFEAFLGVVELAETLLEDQGYAGVYQIASFHPDYQFEGYAADDPANATNQSPYPMLHLLREDSITAALLHYPDPWKIPLRNRDIARKWKQGRL